jgi:hypothetical protein
MKQFMNKPYSPACDRNGTPILEALQLHFADRRHVLEIGAGTGQHAVRFAAALPQLTWQTSDREDYLPGIRMWLDEAHLPNTPPPLPLDVKGAWPGRGFDALFSANTLHIMAWEEVRILFERLPHILAADARVCIYGPFRYAGQPISPSNAEFDAALRAEDPRRGIRDFDAVDGLAREQGFRLVEDRAMPANNRCLCWQRQD